MRVSLLQLLLLVAIAALAISLYSVSRSYERELEQLQLEHSAAAKEAKKLESKAKAFLDSQTLVWSRITGLPALTAYGRISYFRYRDNAYLGHYGILIRLDPQKNYALCWERRWGVKENPTKLETETLVIEAQQEKGNVSQQIELSINALPNPNVSPDEWAFAGFLSAKATLHVYDGSGQSIKRTTLGEHFSKFKLHRTESQRNFPDYLEIARSISASEPTPVVWLSGWSDETQEVQSLLVTIEELSPARLAELASAKRFLQVPDE